MKYTWLGMFYPRHDLQESETHFMNKDTNETWLSKKLQVDIQYSSGEMFREDYNIKSNTLTYCILGFYASSKVTIQCFILCGLVVKILVGCFGGFGIDNKVGNPKFSGPSSVKSQLWMNQILYIVSTCHQII